MTTPLPAASPLALMTIGIALRAQPAGVEIGAREGAILRGRNPWRRRNSFVNDLEPSSCAQARLGPKQAGPPPGTHRRRP
jgi:hypothetical protein